MASKRERTKDLNVLSDAHIVDIDKQDERGKTAIYLLLENNMHDDIFQLLLKKKPNVKIPSYDGSYPIHMAAKYCKADVVDKLITFGADVNVKDKFKRSPLHYAVACNNQDVIKLLIKKGCDKDAIDSEGNGLLHLAAMRNDPKASETLHFLIEMGIDLFVSNAYGKTVLHYAVMKNETLKVALPYMKKSIDFTDKDGKTALHYACTDTLSYDRVAFLLDNGSDPNLCGKYGRNCLMYACKYGKPKTLDKLLPFFTETINAQDKRGNTALHYASMRTNTTSHIKQLVNKGAIADIQNAQGKTPLMLALETHCTYTIDLLLRQTSNANIQDNQGRSALHYVLLDDMRCKDQDEEQTDKNYGNRLSYTKNYARALLEKGADIHLVDVKTMTPLHYACGCKQDIDIVKLLLSKKADVHAKDFYGRLPIHVAVENEAVDIVQHLLDVWHLKISVPALTRSSDVASYVHLLEFLIRHGISLDQLQPFDGRALIAVARYGTLGSFQLLWKEITSQQAGHIDFGFVLRELCIRNDIKFFQYVFQNSKHIDINTTDENGSTLLHYAARHCDLEIIKELVEAGANIFAEDHMKALPVHVACKHSRRKIIVWLMEKIQEVTQVSQDAMKTPVTLSCYKDDQQRGFLHYAAENKNLDVILYFLNLKLDIHCRDEEHKTALHYGTNHFTINIVKEFFRKDADINSRDINGRTPLHLAAKEGNLSFLKGLIENGGNRDLRDDYGDTAEMLAVSNMQDEAVKILQNYKRLVDNWSMVDNKKRLPLHLACKNTNFHEVCYLLQDEYVVKAVDDVDIDGKAALHYASENGSDQITYILSIFGADLEIKDRFGKTPLHVAVESSNIPTVTLLLHHGASVDVKDKDLRTPLHYSVMAYMKEMTRVLIAHGASVNLKDGQDKTPIEYTNDKDMVWSLRQNACNEAHNIDGNDTQAMKSDVKKGVVGRKWNDVTRFEVDGIDLDYQDENGWSFLHHCILHNMKEFAFMFLRQGVDVNHKTKYAIPFSLMTDKHFDPSKDRICKALSPLLLSTILDRRTIVKYIAEDTTIKSEDFQICLKLALGTPVEEVLMQGLCEQLKRTHHSLFMEAFPAYFQNSPFERIIVGLSKNVTKTKDMHLLSVKVIIRNPDFFDDEDRRDDDENPHLTDDNAQHVKAVISENANRLWKCHSMLNVITGAGQKPTNRADFLDARVILYTELKDIVPLCERPYPTILRNKDKNIDIELREGRALLGPLGSPSYLPYPPSRTLRMGSGIGMSGGPSGTMGPVVDLGNNKLGFLTCAHIFFKEKIQNSSEIQFVFDDQTANIGIHVPLVVQPTDEEMQQIQENYQNDNASNANEDHVATITDDRICGKVTKAKFGTWNGTSIDAALVKITKPERQPNDGKFTALPESNIKTIDFTRSQAVYNSGAIMDSIKLKNGLEVVQFGSSTRCTTGQVVFDGLQARLKTKHPISFVCCEEFGNTFQCSHANVKYDIAGQYEVKSSKRQPTFFNLRDSGSGVFAVDRQNNNKLTCIGIAIAVVPGGNTIVTPIKPILEAFGSISLKDFTNAHGACKKRSYGEAFDTSRETRE